MPTTTYYSPADIVRRLLISLGAGVSPSNGALWPVYATSEPGTPDNVVTVYDTAGLDDGRAMVDGELFRHLGFQVRVRSIDHRSGWDKASEIQNLLARSTYDEVVAMPDDTRYLIHCVSRIGDVIALGKEVPNSKRSLFTVNATVTLTLIPFVEPEPEPIYSPSLDYSDARNSQYVYALLEEWVM